MRRFFEIDRQHIAVAALKALADQGQLDRAIVAAAVARYGLATETPDPWQC